MTVTRTADPRRQVVDLVTGAWRTQIVHTAVALRVPDLVGEGYDTPVALARATGADVDGLSRLVRALCRLGVLAEDGAGRVHATRVGELLAEGEDSLRAVALLYGQEFYLAWSGLTDSVRRGGPVFADTVGAALGEYLQRDPDASLRFQAAMAAGTPFFRELACRHDFGSQPTVVDVAGGDGGLLRAVLAAVPGARGLLVEQPHVIQSAELADGERIEVVEADIFRSVPAGADVYLLARVLQDWDDDRCRELLGACARAMPSGAQLIVVDRVLDLDSVLPALWDLHLMVVAGGRERTADDYLALLVGAGLRVEGHLELPLEMSAIVSRKT